MVVLDESRSFESREIVAKMQATGYFDLMGRVDSYDELRRNIDAERAAVGLILDRDFGKNRHRGAPANALLIVNASDSTTANQASGVAWGSPAAFPSQALLAKGRVEIALDAGRGARSSLVQPRAQDDQLRHPRPDRDRADVHAGPVHRDQHRQGARARHARTAAGHADHRGRS